MNHYNRFEYKTPKNDKKLDQVLRKNGIIFLGGQKNGFSKVKNEDGKENFMTRNGVFLLKKWADNVIDFNNDGFAKAVYFSEGKKIYLIDKNGVISRV